MRIDSVNESEKVRQEQRHPPAGIRVCMYPAFGADPTLFAVVADSSEVCTPAGSQHNTCQNGAAAPGRRLVTGRPKPTAK